MLLVVVYYFGADLFLIDRHVLDVPSWVAILISLGSIVLGWVRLRHALQVADRQLDRPG